MSALTLSEQPHRNRITALSKANCRRANANVYLHYVFDLWVEAWRKKVASGDVVVVRYADDLVVGFEHRTDAERFLPEFQDRPRRQVGCRMAAGRLELENQSSSIEEVARRNALMDAKVILTYGRQLNNLHIQERRLRNQREADRAELREL